MFRAKYTNWSIPLKLGILGIILYVIWVFNRSFTTPLLLGLIFATLTYPIFEFYVKKVFNFLGERRAIGISAITTILAVLGVITILINVVATQLIREVPDFARSSVSFAQSLPNNNELITAISGLGFSPDYVKDMLRNVETQVVGLGKSVGSDSNSSADIFNQANINNAFNFSRQTLNVLFNQLVYLSIFILSWFQCLMNGKKWLEHIFQLLPFNKNEVSNITNDFQDGVRNVIYANLLSGAIHAIACFIFMWIFGIPNMFLLSVLIFFIGVLPLSPSELGYSIPILLVFPSNPLAALIFALIGEAIILWVNYILIPKIIASGEEGNPLLILTSILSGISIFGLMGFIIGPLIIIFVQTLYRILMKRIDDEEIKILPKKQENQA
jgi:predicted PurR-regulated permease PerM